MKKLLYVFVPVFICLTVLISSFSSTVQMSESISDKVFRLHILANSDNKTDQELKLKVRDEIISLSEGLFSDCENVTDAIRAAKDNIELIENTALKVINNNGFNYTAKVYVTNEYFNTRKYEDFTLPAGFYNSLKIEIGQGKGKNWWCVMFPAVCISGCTSEFENALTDEEIQLIEEDKYIIKFKAVEIYESIKNRLQ